MSKRKTHEEFIKEFQEKNGHSKTIEIIGTYINKNTPIECKCKVCNRTWFPLPYSLTKDKSGCPDCRYAVISIKNRKSHDTFISQMQTINPNITILEKYVDDKTYLKCKCNKCGYIWSSPPSRLLRNKGCPNYRKHIDFIRSKTKDYTGSKIGMLTVLKRIITKDEVFYECLCDCGNYINIQSSKLKKLKSCGCKVSNQKKGIFVDITGKIYGKLTVIKRVENRNKDLYWLCRCECGNEVIVRGSYLKSGITKSCGCLCSKGEYIVAKWLKVHNTEFETHKRFSELVGVNNGQLSYDFYLPRYNFLVEIQGIQHEKSVDMFGGEERLKIQQEHDRRKREYAKNNGYRLLEIWYYDFDNIEEILNRELEVV